MPITRTTYNNGCAFTHKINVYWNVWFDHGYEPWFGYIMSLYKNLGSSTIQGGVVYNISGSGSSEVADLYINQSTPANNPWEANQKCNSHSEEVGGQVYDDWHLPSQDEYLDILNLYNEHLPLNDYTYYFTSNGTILDRSTNQFIEQYNIPSEIGYICIRKSSNRYRLF